LAKSGCQRVALAFRARRFVSLCVRSVVHGDVPLGWFWLGWSATPWTPSGFEGWTTGKKPRIFPRPSIAAILALFAPKRPAFDLALQTSVLFRPNMQLVANRELLSRPSEPPPASEQKVA